MNLEDCAEPLAGDIAFWLLGLEDPANPMEQLGRLSGEIAVKLRALGIILLLSNADSDGFYFNLIRSGRARLTYLLRARDLDATDDHHFASGRYGPLVDAIAAGDFDLARAIAAASPSEWREGHEYEDDYCYAQIFHRFVQIAPHEEEIPPLLQRLEAYLDGQTSARLAVCTALSARSQEAFDESFESFINERETQIAADKERGQLEEPAVMAQRPVFVEGLAVLRLAALRGLQTQPEYRLCPSLARVPMSRPFPER